MSADFWAGYASGAVGILVGNPLDLIKVRKQAAGQDPIVKPQLRSLTTLLSGTAAPILGYGALNAILFVTYNRTEALLNSLNNNYHGSGQPGSLWATWLAGAAGGLSIWAVSTPTELIKCRAQMSSSSMNSSWDITKQLWRSEGIRGLYLGGVVTALRDSIGYGFYFWAYEGLNRSWPTGADQGDGRGESSLLQEVSKVLLCGGVAGIVTWASVFPLDVIKTRVQIQPLGWIAPVAESSRLLGEQPGIVRSEGSIGSRRKIGAVEAAREAYRQGGVRVFFAGLTVCSVRAFVVNAVQWAVYEWMMHEMGQGRKQRQLLDPAGGY